MDRLGLYISFPFCRSKCSYCNFASGVYAPSRMRQYVDRLCEEVAEAAEHAEFLQSNLPQQVDTVYFGGGTPSLIAPDDLERFFAAIHDKFTLTADAEITMECAPGQLTDDLLAVWLRLGVNRVSLGVQSFIDSEAAAVGRLHTSEICRTEITRLRDAGIRNINVDLIAGLPHQTMDSWQQSLDALLQTDVPHASVYMFEVDEDSRLGLEILQGGKRYRAADVPDDESVTAMYAVACERLNTAGIHQYEISNFARRGSQSLHNLRYWLRRPYLGMGLDAHSMLASKNGGNEAMRFANTDNLDLYCDGEPYLRPERISELQALEETFFLGLRQNAGIQPKQIAAQFGTAAEVYNDTLRELVAEGFLQIDGDSIMLSHKGRLLSNEVFGRLMECSAV